MRESSSLLFERGSSRALKERAKGYLDLATLASKTLCWGEGGMTGTLSYDLVAGGISGRKTENGRKRGPSNSERI